LVQDEATSDQVPWGFSSWTSFVELLTSTRLPPIIPVRVAAGLLSGCHWFVVSE
jgi:hypothetical protein